MSEKVAGIKCPNCGSKRLRSYDSLNPWHKTVEECLEDDFESPLDNELTLFYICYDCNHEGTIDGYITKWNAWK